MYNELDGRVLFSVYRSARGFIWQQEDTVMSLEVEKKRIGLFHIECIALKLWVLLQPTHQLHKFSEVVRKNLIYVVLWDSVVVSVRS